MFEQTCSSTLVGMLSQACLGTCWHCCLGTSEHCSRWTGVHCALCSWTGTVWQFCFGTCWHCWRGTCQSNMTLFNLSFLVKKIGTQQLYLPRLIINLTGHLTVLFSKKNSLDALKIWGFIRQICYLLLLLLFCNKYTFFIMIL